MFIYRTLLHLLFSFCFLTACAAKPSETAPASKDFRIVTVLDNLDFPWSLAFLPDGDILITERNGKMLRYRKDGELHFVSGLPDIHPTGQGGLLDVILDPDFPTNRTIYFSFVAKDNGGYGTEVARAVLDRSSLKNVQVIFRAIPKTSSSIHFGSRLLFAPDGTLIISLGEKGRMREAQNTSNHLGSIIRINPDGSLPHDNPYINRNGYRPELYTYGNRNVQGIALHPETGKIWFHEHGPKGGDELNILKSGANYGWPAITYGVDYSGAIISEKTALPGMEQPSTYWVPSIAPSGMAIYDGNAFPDWKGNIFIGALVQRHLRRVILQGEQIIDQEILLKDLKERIRDVRTGPDGYLYLLTDSRNGKLLRLEPLSTQ
ncbi:PQQ-dependent sugar dehydrogenase [Prosthecochloris sp. SCSIO W1101]|uniref:PQQ-dependent sugar dehydrogenase n=1 Tax=Prosthecochloris sp. SCSIO W1101 TaxID=2992242 RepID=UPI00223DBD62|nr:PQQ-dependent sugar dehydrogenase [Prosthecochloris sp. SCSIO W1101]UZJ41769.1 PQQ-dependent sugar dehydrogenase [Prosthecochloris sp. SCSIO W1101]